MNKYLKQYVREIDINMCFWNDFGYFDLHSILPSCEPRFQKKIFFKFPTIIQCDDCLKWRSWPAVTEDMGKNFAEWTCSQSRGAVIK